LFVNLSIGIWLALLPIIAIARLAGSYDASVQFLSCASAIFVVRQFDLCFAFVLCNWLIRAFFCESFAGGF
jgi:hypothetical protein